MYGIQYEEKSFPNDWRSLHMYVKKFTELGSAQNVFLHCVVEPGIAVGFISIG